MRNEEPLANLLDRANKMLAEYKNKRRDTNEKVYQSVCQAKIDALETTLKALTTPDDLQKLAALSVACDAAKQDRRFVNHKTYRESIFNALRESEVVDFMMTAMYFLSSMNYANTPLTSNAPF